KPFEHRHELLPMGLPGGEQAQHAPDDSEHAVRNRGYAKGAGAAPLRGRPRRPATAPPVGGPPGFAPRLLRRGDTERERLIAEHERSTVPGDRTQLEPVPRSELLADGDVVDDAVDLHLRAIGPAH